MKFLQREPYHGSDLRPADPFRQGFPTLNETYVREKFNLKNNSNVSRLYVSSEHSLRMY